MRRWRIGRVAPLLGALAACTPAVPVDTPPAAPPRAAGLTAALAVAESGIGAEAVRARIAYLASDEMRGRDTPSPELERAAEYLAAELRGMGLQPAGDPGSYVQRWPYRQQAMEAAAVRLTVETPRGTPAMVYGRDFFAVPAARDSVAGTPVFVGHVSRVMGGFPADVADRIALVAIGVNLGAEIVQLSRLAEQAGARGLLFVLHPTHTAPVVQQAAQQIGGSGIEVPLPTFGVRHENAQAILRAAGLDAAVLDDAAHARPVVLTGATLRMEAPLRRSETRVPNVAAMLPGRDPTLRDEYVVLSAHFDHVGVGAPDAAGDSIYNGADDNASGTAALLEVARAMAALPEALRPRRSVIFLAVSGEEKGLLGSRYYADNPTVPIDRIVANINLDMISRNAPDEIIAIGPEYTDLGAVAERIARENPALGLRVVPDEMPEEMLFFRSDHVSFVRHDIPAIFFFAGLHADYHRPSDTLDRVDADKAARVARLVFRMAHEVADAEARPQWLEGRLEEVRRILRASPF